MCVEAQRVLEQLVYGDEAQLFVGKLYLFAAGIEAGWTWVAIVGVLTALFTQWVNRFGKVDEGTTVTWDFHDFPGAFPVHVRKVERDRLIAKVPAVVHGLRGLVAARLGGEDDLDLPDALLWRQRRRLVDPVHGSHRPGDVLEHGADGEQVALVVVDDQHARLPVGPERFAFQRLDRRGFERLCGRHCYSAAVWVSGICSPARLRARVTHTRSSASSRSMSTGLAI